MATAPKKSVDVVVVGAGLSGLRAALELKDAGLSYMVLEAMDRVGGRTLSVPTTSEVSGKVDMGAAWINDTTQSEMYALAQKFGFDLVKQRTEGDTLYELSTGNFTALPYDDPPASDLEQLAAMEAMMLGISLTVESLDLQNPHHCPEAEELDKMTALDYVKETYGEGLPALVVTVLTRALVGADPDEMSALNLVQYFKTATGVTNLTSEKQDGGQYLRNRQGNQTFAQRFAESLNQSCLKLSTPVTKITQAENGCIVETENGDKYHSKKVIVSVPTNLFHKIQFEPALPAAKQKLSESTICGGTSKTVLVYDKPWWHDAGLSGAFNGGPEGPIAFARDTCVPEDDQYSITCFTAGTPGREWAKLPAEERKNVVIKHFNAAFGSVVKDIPEPISVVEKIWLHDPWTLGAVTTVMPPGILTSDAGKSIRDPHGSIHFVGTETAFEWMGYMEGAVRSGIRGAEEVIAEIGSGATLLERLGVTSAVNAITNQVSLAI